jgi:ribosomal protein L11 methyltransferase
MHALHLTCKSDEVDELSANLWDAGTEGIEELDRGDSVELVAGFNDDARGSELIARFGDFAPEWQQQADIDWVAYTQEMWPPREIGDRLFLAPYWSTAQTPIGRERIIHNPGAASGTGEHACTRLSLAALEEVVWAGARVLDIGTGSGILAIAALRLGAGSAFGVDTDGEALHVARDNFRLNGLEPTLITGNTDCLAAACADVVIANISGTVLLSIFDDLLRITRPDAQIILSGFTENELWRFLHLLPGASVTALNEWRCVSAKLSSWER